MHEQNNCIWNIKHYSVLNKPIILHCCRFNELYDKYYKEVYPARLVFVSFLRAQHAEGQMVSKLHKMGYEPLQYKFHQSAPDLTKLDTLFGLLPAESSKFEDQVSEVEKKIKSQGVVHVFEQLTVKDGPASK